MGPLMTPDVFRLLVVSTLLITCSGCALTHKQKDLSQVQALRPVNTPRELCKATLPKYRIEPPDILDIDVVRTVPNANYRLNTADLVRVKVERKEIAALVVGDVLSVRVPGAPAVSPIDGNFAVQLDGSISLGTPYGSVRVSGLTLEQAKSGIESALSKVLVASDTYVSLVQTAAPVDAEFAIEIDGTIDFGHPFGRVRIDGLTIAEARKVLSEHFQDYLLSPAISLTLIQSSILQQVEGEHLVGPDGHITLGIYGSIEVVGLTLEEANAVIASRLSDVLDEPKVATSVLSYNSKLFYIITQGPGIGDGVYRFPVTGNDTVLDALSLIQGIPQGSSSEMWIARPNPVGGCYQVLPVDWEKVTSLAATETNYQLMPGDRLFIRRDPFITFDTKLAKFISPLERILGFSILGAETGHPLSGPVLRGGGNPRGRF